MYNYNSIQSLTWNNSRYINYSVYYTNILKVLELFVDLNRWNSDPGKKINRFNNNWTNLDKKKILLKPNSSELTIFCCFATTNLTFNARALG